MTLSRQPGPASIAHPMVTAAAALHIPAEPVPAETRRRRFVEDVLPLLTSVSLHAGVLVLGVLTYQAIQVIRHPAVQMQQVIADSALVDGNRSSILGADETKPWTRPQQDQIPEDTNPAGINTFRSTVASLTDAGGGADNARDALIGVGPGGGFGMGGGLGTHSGPGKGTGDGAGGLLRQFGTVQVGGVKNPIFGTNQGAHRITYVCDASGSMINKMASLRLELTKSVMGLRLSQSFGIVFFQESRCTAFDAGLVQATPANQRKSSAFIESVTPTGITNPIPGIEAAFRQQPELIYLLTDGDFPDNAAVLNKVRELNKGHRVRVNTIAFTGSGDTDTAFIDLLKTVAQENGGQFKHVSEEDLGR